VQAYSRLAQQVSNDDQHSSSYDPESAVDVVEQEAELGLAREIDNLMAQVRYQSYTTISSSVVCCALFFEAKIIRFSATFVRTMP
jgi:hypothetical protein